MRTLLVAVALVPALAGCGDLFGNKDAHQPGEALGTFHVVGTRTSNQCGEGALGSTPSWAFDVDLARSGSALHWDNGAQVLTGGIGEDGVSFTIEATVVVDMRGEEGAGYPPCSVERHDKAEGALDGEGVDIAGFDATLSYDFAPTAGSECSDLILGSELQGDTPVFARLPCGMVYALEATRTAAPSE